MYRRLFAHVGVACWIVQKVGSSLAALTFSCGVWVSVRHKKAPGRRRLNYERINVCICA